MVHKPFVYDISHKECPHAGYILMVKPHLTGIYWQAEYN